MTDGSGSNHMKCNPDTPTVWAKLELPGVSVFIFLLKMQILSVIMEIGIKGNTHEVSKR